MPVEPQRPAPVVLKYERGDNYSNALKAFIRDGDSSGLRSQMVGQNELEIRASNNTDMNIGTAADGGDTVPTGFYNQIIAKRSEYSLAERLGVTRIPGVGTTVDVPYDNEADGEFVSTAEATTFDQDAPALAKASMTLVKYSKYITLSYELLQDTGVNLEGFLSDWIARGMAKTMNQLLVTEAGTTGTLYKTTAASTAIAAGELEPVVLNDTVGDYLSDGPNVAWVMRPTTFSVISTITGSNRMYAPFVAGSGVSGRELLGYPVHFSQKPAAIASTAKVAYFGNWNYMGWREAPGFTLLRDPYSAAGTGQVKLWMYFRTVFKQLQAGAIGYLKMKT
jgi:HK97 family phage major capsid protein